MTKRHFIVTAAILAAIPLLSPQIARGQSASVQINGISLRYEIEGSGKPLVLVHGWAVHRGFWDGEVERFAPHYTVIRYDRRGFGESSGKPDLSADPADLKALLETLGYSQVRIMGHSGGTNVALTFAIRYPEMVDALIMFGPVPPSGFDLPFDGEDAPPMAELVETARMHGIDSVRAIISAWTAEQFGGSSSDDAERGRALLETYTGLDLIDPAPPSNLVEPARIDELRAVKAPTLIILGQDEMPYLRIVADVLTYGITGAKKIVVPGGGHVVNWAEPERFAAEILRFLREAVEVSGGS